MRRALPAVLVLALVLALVPAGCSGRDAEVQQVDNLAYVYYDEAATLAKERADAIAELLDRPLEDPHVSTPPCEDPAGNPSGSGVYHLHSSYTLPVGADKLAEALRTAHAYFTGQGFDVEDIRWFDDGSGDLEARAADGFEYSLLSTQPPVALALWVDSPCYQAPDDEAEEYRWRPPFPLESPTADPDRR